jgi:hypothetical protein
VESVKNNVICAISQKCQNINNTFGEQITVMPCHSHIIAVFGNDSGFVAWMTQAKWLLSVRNCTWSEKNIYCEHCENDCQEVFSRFDECFAHDEFWPTCNPRKPRPQLTSFLRRNCEMSSVQCECHLHTSKQKWHGG